MTEIDEYYMHEGIRIRYRDMGSGRPLVFLHGFATSLDTWRFLSAELKKEYRLLLVDLKGHGLSDRPHDGRYSIQEHSSVVLGFITHVGLDDIVIVGHSLGVVVGLGVALELQKSNSSRSVNRLFAIAGSVDVNNFPLALRILRTRVLGWLSLKLTSASFRTKLMLKRAYWDDSKVTDYLVELYAGYQRLPGSDHSLLKTAEQIIPADYASLKEALAKLKLPVINIWGEHDIAISKLSAESLCSLLPRCAFVTLEGVGHVPQEERPEKVIELLREFLRAD